MSGNKWRQFSKTTNSIKTRSQAKEKQDTSPGNAPTGEVIPIPDVHPELPSIPENALPSDLALAPPIRTLF